MMLHLEICTKCALKCPGCSRTAHPGTFEVTEMDLAAVANALDAGRDFRIILLCGDHGDPIYHSRYHDILDLCHEKHPGVPVVTATNGSFRDAGWWRETARRLHKIDVMVFGIDGLEDTSHIYRVGNDWASATEGLKTLRAHSECEIRWQWIKFRYNEHQLAEAMRLAEDWGVDIFEITRSFRDIPNQPQFNSPREDVFDDLPAL